MKTKTPPETEMPHSSLSYLSTSGQFHMPSTTEIDSSISESDRVHPVHFVSDNVSIPMSSYFENRINQPETVSLPEVSSNGTGTRNVQHHSNPSYIAGISAIQQVHHLPSSSGLMKNIEDETDALPCEPPPTYNELFDRKPNTAEAGTSMDTTTITITRTITVPNNRTNPNRYEHPAANHAPYNQQLPSEKNITCTCVTFKLVIIALLFFAVYYITTFVMRVLLCIDINRRPSRY